MNERVRIDDPAHVQAQYVTEENLETRRSVWHPTADGRDPTTEALDAIVADNPLRVLEVGPGTGMFAVRLAAALPDASITTIDQSERFVEMTRARGIDSRVGDAQDLPYADESFDSMLEIGFGSSIKREYEWRLKRGESLANLQAFAHLADPDTTG